MQLCISKKMSGNYTSMSLACIIAGVHHNLPESAVRHGAPATTCIALDPALQLLVSLPCDRCPALVADPLE